MRKWSKIKKKKKKEKEKKKKRKQTTKDKQKKNKQTANKQIWKQGKKYFKVACVVDIKLFFYVLILL